MINALQNDNSKILQIKRNKLGDWRDILMLGSYNRQKNRISRKFVNLIQFTMQKVEKIIHDFEADTVVSVKDFHDDFY